MSSKTVVVCLVGLLALLVLPAAYAGDGTPNLGTTQVAQVDSRWFVDARIYDTGNGQDWNANTTLSLGFIAPINPNAEFGLMYSELDNAGKDPIGGVLPSTSAIRISERRVLSPSVKFRLNNGGSSMGVALTVGADVELGKSKGINSLNGGEAYQKAFTPAAKLQIEFGQPGNFQFQVAGQAAWWPSWCNTNRGAQIPGFGTVVSLGGGVVFPLGSHIVLMGDAMVPVDGDNYINENTNLPDTEVAWSAGGTWMFGDSSNTTLSVYATNSMAPTLAASVIGTPDDSVGVGAALRRNF